MTPSPASGATGLRPFVPARDFAESQAFYRALGFAQRYADDDIAVLTHGAAEFILQNYYDRVFAENCMIQLLVDDVAAWWHATDPVAVAARSGARPPTPPARQPWNAIVGFVWDPSGVLWQVTQLAV